MIFDQQFGHVSRKNTKAAWNLGLSCVVGWVWKEIWAHLGLRYVVLVLAALAHELLGISAGWVSGKRMTDMWA